MQSGETISLSPILDSVDSFAEYAHLSKTHVYRYTRGKGFPKIQPHKGGRILIIRHAAIEWLQNLTKARL